MDKAGEDGDRVGKTLTCDSTTKMRFNDGWGGAGTRIGVDGNPLQATPEKGKPILEPVMPERPVRLDEFRVWPMDKRQDQHRRPVQRDIRG